MSSFFFVYEDGNVYKSINHFITPKDKKVRNNSYLILDKNNNPLRNKPNDKGISLGIMGMVIRAALKLGLHKEETDGLRNQKCIR